MSYKDTCPQCGKDNLYITPHNGVSYCFTPGCEYFENGKHVLRKKERSTHIQDIRAYYTVMAEYYHSNLNTHARNYLYKRGFIDTTIQELKIGYCPTGKHHYYNTPIALESGLTTNRKDGFLAGRITFPYFKTKDIVSDIRGRAVDKTDIRYKSPFGDTYYRGADYPYNYHLYNTAPVVLLTEGEIKADIAMQVGYPTLALPGIKTWRKGFTQKDNQKIIIVFDTQKDMSGIRLAIDKIQSFVESSYVATLPLMGKDKMDIDTLILEYGSDIFDMVIESALPYYDWKVLQMF